MQKTEKLRWIGRWLMAIGIIHSLLAFVDYRYQLGELIELGLFDAVGRDSAKGEAVWYVLAGLIVFILGLACDHIEKHDRLPKAVGAGLLVLAGLGALLIPAGGFWLFFPPAIAIIMRDDGGRSGGD